jgi:hypothetical protein
MRKPLFPGTLSSALQILGFSWVKTRGLDSITRTKGVHGGGATAGRISTIGPVLVAYRDPSATLRIAVSPGQSSSIYITSANAGLAFRKKAPAKNTKAAPASVTKIRDVISGAAPHTNDLRAPSTITAIGLKPNQGLNVSGTMVIG